MSEPFLLVPIALEALVVNHSDRRNTLWSITEKNYTGIPRFEAIEPPPFVRGNDGAREGITLHWALPDALTRGRQKNGKLLFPLIPNRWLVVRSARTPTRPDRPSSPLNQAQPLKAWFVESDHLGPGGTNLCPKPPAQPPPGANGSSSTTRLGRKFDLGPRPSPETRNPLFLTALGGLPPNQPGAEPVPGGDPTFAAYAPNVDNVLALYDDLSDLTAGGLGPSDEARLSYLVAGWYSDPAADAMSALARVGQPWALAADWAALMNEYAWTVGDDAALVRAVRDATGRDVDPTNPRVSYPSRTLCHGIITGVNWAGFRAKAQSFTNAPDSAFAATPIASRKGHRNPNAPQGDSLFPDVPAPTRTDLPHVAIGNSTTDALAAVVEYISGQDDRIDFATLYQAIEYNLLDRYDEPAGQVELRQQIHQQWFTPVAGETSWEVVAPRKSPAAAPSAQTQEQEGTEAEKVRRKLGPAGLQRLDELNRVQAVCDKLQSRLSRSLRDFYGLWWKQKRLLHLEELPDGVAGRSQFDAAVAAKRTEIDVTAPADLVSMAASVGVAAATGLSRLTANAFARRDAVRAQLNQLLTTLAAQGATPEDRVPLELLERPGARFFKPADPVVVLYGCRRSSRHGGDGRFREDGKLFCRFSGQTISRLDTSRALAGVSEAGVLPAALTSASVAARFGIDTLRQTASTALLGVPDPVWDAAVELILLDPGWAAELARVGLPPNGNAGTATAIATRQRLIWNEMPDVAVTPGALTAVAGFAGVRPSPVAVEQWAQPWCPLFMNWRVKWFPTRYPDEVQPPPDDKTLPDWEFDGQDFKWTGFRVVTTERAVTLQGRCMLSGASTEMVQKNLRALFEATGVLDAATQRRLAEIRGGLEAADFLAQPLTGFHEQLLQLDRTQFYTPPASDLASPLGDLERMAPIAFRNGAPEGTSHFYPVRAGHFQISRIWVVDAFGQVFDPIAERGQTPASFAPLRGSGLVTVGLSQRADTQMLQLPPRIVQGCRVHFRFERDGLTPVRPASNPNPVCGWLLPNHFDNSLAVFDADGHALGALLLSGSVAGTPRLIWEPAAGGARALPTPDRIADEHLRPIVQTLLGLEKSGAAFEDFMKVIDRTLWTIDPLGRRDSNLSMLIGRPIAVVRARLQLELLGDPATDQRWEKTLLPASQKTKDFTKIEFPVQVGNIDLRDDGTVGCFLGTDYGRFHAIHNLIPSTAGYVALPGTGRIRLAADGRQHFLTVLMDPRGSVNVESGLVPAKAVRLPKVLVEQPLERMDVTFRVGPLLNEPAGLRMPLPAEIRGGWTWIQKSGVALMPTTESEVTPASHHARLSDTPIRIREGWLRLSAALGSEGAEAQG